MSERSLSSERITLEQGIEMVRNSEVISMNTTVRELLEKITEMRRSGDLEAAKIKNGGVFVTKCFAFVTGCE
jgi:hypothetical protein